MAQQSKVGEVRLFKMFGHFSFVILLVTSSLSAGTFENFKRTQTESFQAYKDERDNEFSKYLKLQWNAYKAERSAQLYQVSKPKSIPFAVPKKIKSVGPVITVTVKKTKLKKMHEEDKTQGNEKIISTAPVVIINMQQIQKENGQEKDINFNFYGSKLGFTMPSGIHEAKFYPLNQKGIANFFASAAISEYETIIEEINNVRKVMNLNDWATYLLVHKISDNVFSNQDESKLLSWFIFNKLGFAVKVGLGDKHVELIYYSKKIIYSTPTYTLGKNKFYLLSKYAQGSLAKLYTYEQNYPGSEMQFDLSLAIIPNFESDMKSKTLSFKEFGKEYNVPFEYNQNLIDFMATYPQADYETYFNAPLDSKTYSGVATALKKYIDGKKASDAINFVLHFVQSSFGYENDNQQFHREKVMFAEETLCYDKSDCEDRAILFAYLVKNLFNIGVVGVKYKDHMATALAIPMSGDSVKDGSRKFVIADPTYIHSSIGQSMPKYRSIIPESFIKINRN